MTVLDIIFCVVIFVLCVRAAIKGFLDEVFGLGSFIIGGFVAFKFTPVLSTYLAKTFNNTVSIILSFLLIFIATFLVIKIIQTLLKNIFSGKILDSLDHCLGFAFGAVEGAFACVVIILLLQFLNQWLNTQRLLDASYIYNFLKKIIDFSKYTILV